MRWRFWLPGVMAFALMQGLAGTLAQIASADAFSYTEDFGKFGKTMNFVCGAKRSMRGRGLHELLHVPGEAISGDLRQ